MKSSRDLTESQVEELNLLGAGGFGAVYKVRDHQTGEIFAMKTIETSGSERLEKEIRREVEMLTQVEQDCTPFLRSVEQKGDTWNLFMEYVPGINLEECWMRGYFNPKYGWPFLRRLRLMRSIAECVQTFHHRGIVHRDLKPANIILVNENVELEKKNWVPREPDRVKIVDFGLSCFLPERTTRTDLVCRGREIGTVEFLPPEVWEGEISSLPHDIYSLGVLFYLIITELSLVDPFEGMMHEATLMAEISVSRKAEDMFPLESSQYRFITSVVRSMVSLIENRPEIDFVIEDLDRFLREEEKPLIQLGDRGQLSSFLLQCQEKVGSHLHLPKTVVAQVMEEILAQSYLSQLVLQPYNRTYLLLQGPKESLSKIKSQLVALGGKKNRFGWLFFRKRQKEVQKILLSSM